MTASRGPSSQPLKVPNLSTPAGAIDTHIHFPQLRVLGGWGPKVNLEEGLRLTLAYFRQQAVTPPAH